MLILTETSHKYSGKLIVNTSKNKKTQNILAIALTNATDKKSLSREKLH
jgi:hypothetical protein